MASIQTHVQISSTRNAILTHCPAHATAANIATRNLTSPRTKINWFKLKKKKEKKYTNNRTISTSWKATPFPKSDCAALCQHRESSGPTFENEAGNAVTVNGDRYVEMLQNFFTPQLSRFPVNKNTLFQQDGARSHTARMSMNAVNGLFPNQVVSRNGDIPWPHPATPT